MNRIVNTVVESLNDLLASAVKVLPAILIALVVIMLTRYVSQFAQRIARQVGPRFLKSRSLQLLLTKTVQITTWILGILIACVIAFPGLELGDVIATLGLGSVAIGFAFQDIFKNFLSGILLLIQEPFRIDDQIIVGDYEGTVEQIDIRTTQIRTYLGERVLLPNSDVFTSAVRVRTAYEYRRTDLGVGVDYNTSLPQAKNILQQTIATVEGVLTDPEPEIDLVGFGDSSIDFVVRYWTNSRQARVRYVQTQAVIAIKKAFDEVDINIPYPIRTLYYYDQEKYNDYLPSDRTSDNADSNDSGGDRYAYKDT